MKAEITMSQLWANPSILGFFFTQQAGDTLSKLLDRADDQEAALERIDDYADETDIDADALGDMFHEMDIDELADEIGIDLSDDEDEDEDEDEQ